MMSKASSCIYRFVALWFAFQITACTNLSHDAPRDFAWPVIDYKTAKYSHTILPNGQIHLEITHLPLEGITPEMLAWWYRVLPVSEVEIEGKRYPFYHLFHLSEHGYIWLKEPATDGSAGIGVGALVARQEWFGAFDSEGAGRITEFSARGMIGHPEVAGVWLGEFRHLFDATPTGSRYRVDSLIGVDWPLIGPAVNWLLRTSTFSEAMLREWERHQIEEVANLRYFLPQLYAQRAQAPNYRLQFR